MKKLLTLLTTLLLLFAFSPRVMASKTVYLLTSQKVNGVTGNWSSNVEEHRLTQVPGTEDYYIKLTSTETDQEVFFGFNVIGDDQYRPETDRLQLTVGGAKTNVQKGNNGHAWLLKVNKSEYDNIVLHISFGANASEHRVWAENGGSTTPTVPSYYLIGQLLNSSWSDRNEDGYKLTTTDNEKYSYTVNNRADVKCEFRFRIGTNGNTKATAYHPKAETVEPSGDHKNGRYLVLATEEGMEQSESDNYWYTTLEPGHSYTFTFNAVKKTIIYKDKGDDELGKAKGYELVISYGTTTKVLPFIESRWRKERNAAMPYSANLATVGFKDEQLPGKAGDDIRIYARKTADHNFTLNPAKDGSTFGDELQPTGAKYSSIKSYKTESFVVNKDENTNAFIITKGSGVSYTVGLNLGEEIKATTKTASGANNNISHKVNARSLSLFTNKSMSEVYNAYATSKGQSYDEKTANFYLIGAMDGKNYKKDKADSKLMDRTVYLNPITNKTDSVVYTSLIKWDTTDPNGLWFSFAPEFIYDLNIGWKTDPYADDNAWNLVARAQVQDEFDATAQYGCMNLSGNLHPDLCNGEQALNPKVKEPDKYIYYIVRFNVTTSTYRLIFYKENPVIIKRSKNKFIRTYCSNASWDLPAGGKVKAYVVHSFDENTKEGMKSQGVMKLREIKYIPAEMGVVLVADGTGVTADKIEVNLVSKWDGFVENKKELWVNNYAGDTFNNYLVGLSTDGMSVTEGDYDETNHKYVNRNFALNWFSNTKKGKELEERKEVDFTAKENGDASDADYLGFFRLTAKGKIQKEYAYLQLSNKVVDYDLQLTGEKEDDIVVKNADSKLSPNFGMVFDTDFDFVTGINSVSDVKKNSNNGCYTLQGVKVQRPTAPGLYIMNGKKVIVK